METHVTITYKTEYKERPYLVLESISGEVIEFISADFRAREFECIIHPDDMDELADSPEIESVSLSMEVEL